MPENEITDLHIEVLSLLYYTSMRSTAILEKVKGSMEVSDPTIFSALKDLCERGLIRKRVHSKKNVVYEITPRGKEIMDNEGFRQIDTLLLALRNTPRRRQILAQLLAEEIAKELPDEWNTPEGKKVIAGSMIDELDAVKEKMIKILKLSLKKNHE
ncbi:MAG: winged helix DNA-binding protein [Thermoplasmata archaeon]